MGAILAAIEAAIALAVQAGTAIAPLIPGIKAVWNSYATANGATQEDFDKFHALIAPYETDLQNQADEAAAELAATSGTSG